jgi:hypothetical protein
MQITKCCNLLASFEMPDYTRWCEGLHKFIGRKVITIQKLNARLCEEQLRELSSALTRKKQFHISRLECSSRVRWRLTYDILESWSMPQLLQDKLNVFYHDWAPSCIHDEVTTFLNRQLLERWIGRGGNTSWSARSPDLTPSTFPVGLCDRGSLRSATAYNSKQLEGWNKKSECKNWAAFIEERLARSRISSWCVQGNKWSTYWRYVKL